MNNPTREEFDALREEVRKLKEQRTDEIRAVRVEVASADVENRLDNLTAMLQELDRKSDLHTQGFQQVGTILNSHTSAISDVQADVRNILATQSDHGEMLRAILAKLEGE